MQLRANLLPSTVGMNFTLTFDYNSIDWEQFKSTEAIVTIVNVIALLVFLVLWISNINAAEDYSVDIPVQCQKDWKGPVLENPSIKVPGSSAIQCYCPANGQSLGLINPCTAEGIDRLISRVQEAQNEWKSTTFGQRRQVLRSILKYVLENQDSIAMAACRDSGKTRIDASFGEILTTVEKLKWTIAHGEKALTKSNRPTNFLMFYKSNRVVYEPLGVVAACVSWNYPFHNLIGPMISAIFSGNGIIVKGSEQTAWSSEYFTAIVQGALKACGHNPSLVQSIVCWPQVAGHLTSHPQIAHITFIGSRSVAHKVAESAAKALIPLCIELGGKDPAIILDDLGSDIDRVTATLVRGTFQSAGQNCIGIERIICLPKIYDILIPRLQAIITQLRMGSALDSLSPDSKSSPIFDVGASISDANFANIEALIADAVSKGARLLTGGSRYKHPDFPKGHYFQPTLLVDVTPEMAIAENELFAPVCLVMRAESVDDAIKIANSTEYGLGASVFGRRSRDLRKVTDELKTGMVSVNDFGVYYAVQLPFGGVKGSGYGRFAGEEGLRSLCNIKAVCKDRWPILMKTSIPGPLQLPLKNENKGWEMCKGIVEIGYGESLKRRARGIGRMMGL